MPAQGTHLWVDALLGLSDKPGLRSLVAVDPVEQLVLAEQQRRDAEAKEKVAEGKRQAELAKAQKILELEQQVEKLTEGVTRAEKQREWKAGRNAGVENDLNTTVESIQNTEDGIQQSQVDRDTLLTELQHQIEVGRMRVQVLQAEGERRRKERDEAERAYKRECAELREALMRGCAEKSRDDVENQLLVRMLNAELDKRKHECQELEARLEVQAREDSKNTILLGLLNSQLLAGRTENDELRRESDELLRTQRSVEDNLSVAQQKASLLRRSTDRDGRDHVSRCDDHQYTIARLQQGHGRQETLVDALERELRVQKDALSSAAASAKVRERELSDAIALKRAELSKIRGHTKDLETRIRELHQEDFAQQQLRETECQKLRIAREGLARRTEDADMRDFQTVAEQASQIELLKGQLEMQQHRGNRFDDEAEERLQTLRAETEHILQSTAIVRSHSEERDRESFEMISKVTAKNEALRRRVTELEAESVNRDTAHVKERIAVRAEADRHARDVTALQEQAERQSRDHCQRIIDLQRELDQLRSTEGTRDEDAKRAIRDLRDRTEIAGKESRAQAAHAKGLEATAAQQEAHFRQRETAFKAEMRARKQEVRELQGTVTTLEAKVAETHGYRVLAEENKMLEEDLVDLKRQEDTLENTIATMRVEKDLLEGYKTKVLKEQNEKHEERVRELEKRRQMLQPLLQELVTTALKHRVADSAVNAVTRCAREIGMPMQGAGGGGGAPASAPRAIGYSGGGGPRSAAA